MKKKALITGVTGQDGSYLAEFLLKKNYFVHGLIRRTSSFNTSRIDHIYEAPDKKNRKFILHYGDMTDGLAISKLIAKIKPDEIYNLAAQSHVNVSFQIPDYTSNVNALGTLRILEAVKSLKLKSKIYQASTSEQFGNFSKKYLTEKSFFDPRSPYAASKVFAHNMIKIYRESYNIFCCSGILFNHESERRGGTFVTQKIVRGLKNIVNKKQKFLTLGNLYARRDWGYAPEYVEAMWRMLQKKKPEDLVISTGQIFSVKKFVELTAKELGFDIKWIGKGEKEKGIVSKIYNKKIKNIKPKQLIVKIDRKYFRPNEVDHLLGSSRLAKTKIKWEAKTKIKKLIKKMILNNLET